MKIYLLSIVLLIAVGEAGTILTSPDGIKWEVKQGLATSRRLDGIGRLEDRLITVGEAGTILGITLP